MLNRMPAGDSIESLYSRVEAATDAWFFRVETSLRRLARRLLLALILFSITISILSCIVITGVGIGVWGNRTRTTRNLSPAQITETYGAEQFHIQLTAQAEEAIQRRSP